MSTKISNDTIGKQTRYLPTCSAVPQPTALPRISTLSAIEIVFSTFTYNVPSDIIISQQISVYFVNPRGIYLCNLSLYLFIHLTP